MREAERQVLAMRLYDEWQETETSDSLEIYCYEQGRADALNIDLEKPMHFTDEQIAWIKAYVINARADERASILERADCDNSECWNCAMADGDMNCMLKEHSNLKGDVDIDADKTRSQE